MEKNVKTSPEQGDDSGRPRMASPPGGNEDVVPATAVSASSDTPAIVPESDAVTRPAGTYEIDVGTFYGFGGDQGAAPEVDQGRKRGRGDVNPAGESSHGDQKVARKKGELTDVPKGEPKCATCNKTFKSWKALFGHLRSHPERTYRGALPPPTAMELDLKQTDDDHPQQHLASTLLSAAQVVASRLSSRGLDIDLNQPSTEEGSPSNKGGLDIDLNVVPAAESDEEDDED